MIVPVILAGGSGSRLWPLSRQHYPKQLLKLFGDKTMLQQTLLRLAGLPDMGAPIVVCNEEHRFMVAEQLMEIGCTNALIMLEPVARNTAPALALAALQAGATNQNPTLLVLSADHMIRDVMEFQRVVKVAVDAAEEGRLMTFGVQPLTPETGYGYIKTEDTNSVTSGCLAVTEFVEKPDLETAKEYLAAGCYYWNSGMFVFAADVFLRELEEHSPELVATTRTAQEQAVQDLDFIRVNREAFAKAPNISIDYALMEKSRNVVCVPLNAGWSDVGDWKSFAELLDKDASNNSFIGDALDVGSTNTMVFSRDKLVATIGVNNLMIINTPDAVLVADKAYAQQVKSIIGKIEQQQRSEHLQHREVYRPWGCYDAVDDGDRYQVNRIRVKPGASLSLQVHHHRAEHWIVVKGTALVQKADEVMMLSENESTYIPIGTKHRLSNPGKIPLEIIEVQSGPYLKDDDVIRYEDSYGRS